ncbi:MAG: helix-turn-helix transcriptional regulator [Bdellovibrionaceae bacterium]|jgi:transcriptional regulator with XRE-family HTH domain|nr:helix-turn-helix transcriptional regulator [Pseudobdellovibrionaceae bacterium]
MTDKQRFLKKLGKHIAKVRKSKGYSQDRVFLETEGFSRSTVSRIEKGQVNPEVWTLARIATTLGISLSKLLDID